MVLEELNRRLPCAPACLLFVLCFQESLRLRMAVIASQPTAEEMKQELFGVHLFGVVGFGELWNECIEPDGDTLYTIGDRQDRGKAWVPEDGVICFNYGGPDHCFNAYRDGEGFSIPRERDNLANDENSRKC